MIRPHGWLDKIVLMPSLSGLWGSNNIVFSQLRPGQSAKKQKVKPEPVSQTVSGLLDYELSLPVRLHKDNFRFLVTCHYVIPHALSPSEGDLKPIGYLTASISYVLKHN